MPAMAPLHPAGPRTTNQSEPFLADFIHSSHNFHNCRTNGGEPVRNGHRTPNDPLLRAGLLPVRLLDQQAAMVHENHKRFHNPNAKTVSCGG